MRCPLCGKDGLKVITREHNIQHFGKIVISTVICPHCGYRHSDVVELEETGEKEEKLVVDKPEKLNYYVVRSATGTIEIPELGLELTPGPFSEGFITTVEGVLDRFLRVARLLRAKDKEEEIKRAAEGNVRFTIVIKDPRGLSRIIPNVFSESSR